IDSSIVTAIAAQKLERKLQTFSVAFDLAEFDESAIALEIARRYRTDHHRIELSEEEVIHSVMEAVDKLDLPSVDAINTYIVSRAVAKHGLKVALSGLGGDELFGGYASFHDVPRAVRWRRRLRRFGWVRRCLTRMVGQVSGRSAAKAAEVLKRKPSPLQMYFLRRELFLPAERRALHPLPEDCDPFSGMSHNLMEDLSADARGLDAINQVSLFELSAYMRNMLLRDAD